MPSIAHIDIPADNLERARKFYSDLMGWKFEQWQDSDYWLFSSKDIKGNEGIGGGLLKKTTDIKDPVYYIDIDNIDNTLKKIEKEGGKVVLEKTPIPGVGYYAFFMDTEGNVLALFEDIKDAK